MISALSIKNLQKTYATGVHALNGINLDVAEGDFFGLLGPNGAGKTTIIGIVTGLTNKSFGSVSVFEHDIDIAPSLAKATIGVVPQEFNFSIFEKVLDIVIDQAGYYGIKKKVAVINAEKFLKQLGLWGKRNEKARNLSGGMKRRLMIARALVHEPKLLILDEPTAGVDIELRHDMWKFLRELNKNGTTIILTTHYLEEAEQLCRNVAIINKGDIVEYGMVKDLLEKLHTETFIFDLETPLSQAIEQLLANFHVKKIDSHTIEMTLGKDESLNDAVLALNRLNIHVSSMRNKANRLEELFLHLTRAHLKNNL